MINLIKAIPENFGWALVGAAAMLTTIAFNRLCNTVALMIKDAISEESEEII